MKKRVPYSLVALLLTAVLALAFSSCDKNKTEAASLFGPETVAEIDALLARAMPAIHAPGALVGIWMEDGDSLVKAYGLAGTTPERAFTEGLSFRAGSITKTFTANLILQLVDAGMLSLDDPISGFNLDVPDIPDGERITVRMLLDHSSGIFNYGADTRMNETMTAEPHKVWTPAELVAAGVSNPPYFAPGEGCMYSNTNYILLGMIVEKVTGNTYEQELADRITGPLGLSGTYMASGYEITGDHADGYMYNEADSVLEDVTEYVDASVYWTAGAMVSTLEDLHVWGRALAEGQLISPALREAMTAGMRDLPGMTEFFGYPMQYGLGIMEIGDWLGHSGMPIGYSSAMFYLPEKKATMVVSFNLSSASEPGMYLFMKTAGIVFPEEAPW